MPDYSSTRIDRKTDCRLEYVRFEEIWFQGTLMYVLIVLRGQEARLV